MCSENRAFPQFLNLQFSHRGQEMSYSCQEERKDLPLLEDQHSFSCVVITSLQSIEVGPA